MQTNTKNTTLLARVRRRRGQLARLKDRLSPHQDDRREARMWERRAAIERVAGFTAMTMQAHNTFATKPFLARVKWFLTGK